MESLLKSALENGILMATAISITYLTVLQWRLHITAVIVAMVVVGAITAILYKWAFESLFPEGTERKQPSSVIATVAHFGILFAVLSAQYYIIRKRFDLQERIYILAATAFSADFFKVVLRNL
jgi:cytochrome c biogenesis factor